MTHHIDRSAVPLTESRHAKCGETFNTSMLSSSRSRHTYPYQTGNIFPFLSALLRDRTGTPCWTRNRTCYPGRCRSAAARTRDWLNGSIMHSVIANSVPGRGGVLLFLFVFPRRRFSSLAFVMPLYSCMAKLVASSRFCASSFHPFAIASSRCCALSFHPFAVQVQSTIPFHTKRRFRGVASRFA